MFNKSPPLSSRFVTSLKVAAMVAVLGSVVLAAEQRNGTERPAAPSVAERTATPSRPQEALADHSLAQLPAPAGPVAQSSPTF